MIRRIEEHNNLDLFGEDFVHFHIFFDNKDGIEVKMPWIISFWNLRKFLNSYDPDAANYISKVSNGIRSYGSKDSKILEILHSEEMPINSFVEKYMSTLSEDLLQKHIDWSENLKINPAFREKANELELLLPDLAFGNSRRKIFADALDEAINKEIRNFYPEFFDKIDSKSYTRYDAVLMNEVNNLVTKLNDFFYNESQK
ncbi:hypothetical protein SAMN05421789_102135 [Kaistella chaponensis]|uniref:Uncharacterized protein n=2 Tax=Kaistella chaponensis TaxID=713588 RepID=A0A1N7JJ47_9FLAO|nr:hypothetical protein [Kaistella chaponensis]SIS49373.1 hypothetical protein SAMN05421789_102135 [Kaistella chaponensis]